MSVGACIVIGGGHALGGGCRCVWAWSHDNLSCALKGEKSESIDEDNRRHSHKHVTQTHTRTAADAHNKLCRVKCLHKPIMYTRTTLLRISTTLTTARGLGAASGGSLLSARVYHSLVRSCHKTSLAHATYGAPATWSGCAVRISIRSPETWELTPSPLQRWEGERARERPSRPRSHALCSLFRAFPSPPALFHTFPLAYSMVAAPTNEEHSLLHYSMHGDET